MNIIVALIVMFAGEPIRSEEIHMAPMHIVARASKQETAWDRAMGIIRIIRQHSPTPIDYKIEIE